MFTELTFTDARQNFTEVVDKAQRYIPTVIKPRKRSEDYSILFRLDLIKFLLNSKEKLVQEFTIQEIEEQDNSITYVISPFEIIVNAETKEEAINLAVEDIIDYAKEYMDEKNFIVYFNSPNRRSHLALVMKVLLCDSKDEVKRLFHA
jgi:hypothetical protein